MTDHHMTGSGPEGKDLAIVPVEGEPRILDTDLAKRLGFAKPVKIRDLIKRHDKSLVALGPLPTVGRVINGGEATEFYLNRKQAIFITAKSDTPDATDITIEVIQKFDAYERGLIGNVPARDPMDVLRDPAAMRGLLLTYSEKVLELEAAVATQAPKVEAFDRIAGAEGSMCITDAAKDLQVRPKDLFNWMSGSRWIYQRPGKAGWLAYQDKIQSGYLEHKVTTISRSDGSEKVVEAVRITARGLAKLAQQVPGARRPGPSTQAAE